MGVSLLFRQRDFGLYWAGMLLVQMAVQIQSITIGWQIYGLGRASMTIAESAYLVGLVGLAQFLPMFALTLWAGSLADRHSRRAIVVLALVIEASCVAGLVWVALMPAPDYRYIFAIAALFGAGRAFLSPASSALVPMLVPVADMPQAISLKSLSWQFAVIVGPWLGGMLIAFSTALSYGAALGLFLAGLAMILMLRTGTTPARQPGGQWHQIKEGLRYTWSNKIIFGAISLDLFAVLLGGGDGALAGLCQRYPGRRSAGLWPLAVGPGDRGGGHGADPGALAAAPAGRDPHVLGRCRLWRRDGGVWPVAQSVAVAGGSGGAGGG